MSIKSLFPSVAPFIATKKIPSQIGERVLKYNKFSDDLDSWNSNPANYATDYPLLLAWLQLNNFTTIQFYQMHMVFGDSARETICKQFFSDLYNDLPNIKRGIMGDNTQSFWWDVVDWNSTYYSIKPEWTFSEFNLEWEVWNLSLPMSDYTDFLTWLYTNITPVVGFEIMSVYFADPTDSYSNADFYNLYDKLMSYWSIFSRYEATDYKTYINATTANIYANQLQKINAAGAVFGELPIRPLFSVEPDFYQSLENTFGMGKMETDWLVSINTVYPDQFVSGYCYFALYFYLSCPI